MIQLQRLLFPLALTATFVGTPAWGQSAPETGGDQVECKSNPVPTIKVGATGLNLNFVSLGQVVTKVWLDPPSKVGLDTDSNLDEGGAEILHLKEIKKLNLPYVAPSKDGSALLSVVTQGQQGKKICAFRIVLEGKTQYSTLNVVTKPAPAPEKTLKISLEQVQAGMMVARSKGLLAQEGELHRRLENFLAIYRRGVSLKEAVAQSQVPVEVIEQLETWGSQRPFMPVVPESTTFL